MERVRRRVLQGGHDIPERDIRRRYGRSLANAPVAVALADRASILDNSHLRTVTVAEIEAGRIVWRAVNMPEWAAKILAAAARRTRSSAGFLAASLPGFGCLSRLDNSVRFPPRLGCKPFITTPRPVALEWPRGVSLMQKMKTSTLAAVCAVAVLNAQNTGCGARESDPVRHLVYIATPGDNGTDNQSGIVVLDGSSPRRPRPSRIIWHCPATVRSASWARCQARRPARRVWQSLMCRNRKVLRYMTFAHY